MSGFELLGLCVGGIGFALLFGGLPWFRKRSLVERLRPYAPAGTRRVTPAARSTPVAVLVPLVDQTLDRITRAMGVRDAPAVRLHRADLDITPAAFRSRQVLHALIALAVAAMTSLALRPGPLVAVLALLGAPALAVLAEEQRVMRHIDRRRHVLQLELPVIAEQLGILIDAGISLPSAILRVAQRGSGAAAEDLRQVALRIRHGRSESSALQEWAERTDVEAVRRLVAVLSMHREAGDLGRLISEEARSIRAETHRELLERIERRGQLVWIPVTVSTLVPGLIFLAVPFVSALAQVTGS